MSEEAAIAKDTNEPHTPLWKRPSFWAAAATAVAVVSGVLTILDQAVGLGEKMFSGEPSLSPSVSSPIGPVSTPSICCEPTPDNIRLVMTFRAHTGQPQAGTIAFSVAFSPDGSLIASGGQDKIVRLWDGHTGSLVAELSGHRHIVTSVAFNPKTGVLASGGYDHTIIFWDVSQRKQIASAASHRDEIMDLEFNPDGTLLAAAGGWWVQLFNATTHAFVRDFGLDNESIEDAAFGLDGRAIVTGGGTNTEYLGRLWETATGRMITKLEGHRKWVRDVAVTPNGRTAVTASADSSARTWRVEDGSLAHDFADVTAPLSCAAVSPDGATVALCAGSTIVLRGLDTGAWLASLSGLSSEAWAAAFNPDGTRLAAVASDGNLALWAIGTR